MTAVAAAAAAATLLLLLVHGHRAQPALSQGVKYAAVARSHTSRRVPVMLGVVAAHPHCSQVVASHLAPRWV